MSNSCISKTYNTLFQLVLSIVIVTSCVMIISSASVFAEITFNGNGTEDSPFQITSEEDLINMSEGVNNNEIADKYFVLTSDLELTSEEILSIGTSEVPFTGSFDGQEHTIKGFKQKLTADNGTNPGGLFGVVKGGIIKNLIMESVDVSSTEGHPLGAVIGNFYFKNPVDPETGIEQNEIGMVQNCKVLSGKIISNNGCAGGIIGGCSGLAKPGGEKLLSNLENYATVNGRLAGGVIGSCGHPCSYLINHGSVRGETYAGGITGSLRTSVMNYCSNDGAVTTGHYGGGICGQGRYVVKCNNSGTVKSSAETKEICSIGGIVGKVIDGETGYVSQCSNRGNVYKDISTKTFVIAAGIITSTYYKDTIEQCYNTGSIRGNVAKGIGGCNVTDSFNAGKIVGERDACGIGSQPKHCYNIGVIIAETRDTSYAINEESSQTIPLRGNVYLFNRGVGPKLGGGASQSTVEQMKREDIYDYLSWNFTDVWTMDGIEEYPYPELRNVSMTSDKIDAVEQTLEAIRISEQIALLPENITLDDADVVNEIRNTCSSFVEKYDESALREINNYNTLLEAEATIDHLINIEYAIINTIDPITYTGELLVPEPVVLLNGITLIKDKDYCLAFNNNLNAGAATITITGIGDYIGSTSITFVINPIVVSDADITLSQTEYTFDGGSKEPSVTSVKVDGKVIGAGNYSVSYENNINIGTAYVVITFSGNYSGECRCPFTIKQGEDPGPGPGPGPGPDPGPTVVSVTGVSIDKETLEIVEGDDPVQLTAVVAPEDATNKNVQWESDNTEVATVDADGKVTAVKEGTAKITVTTEDGEKKAVCEVTVKAKEKVLVTGVTLDKETLELTEGDEPVQLTATVAPEDATNKNVAWSSDNEEVATVDADGKVTAVKEGTANITVTTEDGEFKAVCSVTVNAKAEPQPEPEPEPDRKKQMGEDNTPYGKGASLEAAEAALMKRTNDSDPKGTKFAPLMVKSTKQTSKSIKLSWKGASKAAHYIIYANKCGTGKKFQKIVTLSSSKRAYNITKIANAKLKKGTYYKVVIIAVDKNNNVISTSKVKHISTAGNKKAANYKKVVVKAKITKTGKKLKKYMATNAIALRKGSATLLRATAVKAVNTSVKKHVGIRFESSNAKIAKVTSKGKVKGLKKGSCKIYVISQSGVAKTIKVTVK